MLISVYTRTKSTQEFWELASHNNNSISTLIGFPIYVLVICEVTLNKTWRSISLWSNKLKLKLAKDEIFQNIVVEGDSKICLDALNGDDICYPWKIDSICYDSKMLSLAFNSCSFCWVRQEANNVSHCLAKFASLCNLSFCCNNSSLPPSLYVRGLVEWCFLCFRYLNENLFSKKKKKKNNKHKH